MLAVNPLCSLVAFGGCRHTTTAHLLGRPYKVADCPCTSASKTTILPPITQQVTQWLWLWLWLWLCLWLCACCNPLLATVRGPVVGKCDAPSRCNTALVVCLFPSRASIDVYMSAAADRVSGFAGIPREMTGMAEKMKYAGYKTHMTGTWSCTCISCITPLLSTILTFTFTFTSMFGHTLALVKHR